MPPPRPLTTTRTSFVALSLLAGVICVIYWPALSGPFLLDDGSNIPQTRVHPFSLSGLLDAALRNTSGLFGRPIPVATFTLNYLFGDGSPFGFKLINLFIHCLNAGAVYLFCRSAFDACLRASGVSASGKMLHCAAIAAAAAWALHPLQVSTVMYAVQRMALLSTMFSLVALVLYMEMRRRQLEHAHAPPYFLPSIVLSTALACLSKENGALVVIHIALIEALLFRFETGGPVEVRRRFRIAFAGWIALPTLFAAAYFLARTDSLLGGYALRDFDMGERLWTQAAVMTSYLSMILAPKLSEMTFYQDDIAIVRTVDLRTLGHAALVLGACALIPMLARRARVISLGLGLFFLSHLLESTFLPLEIAFEHRNYFGIVGFALVLAWYTILVPPPGLARSGPAALALVALIVLTVQTHSRALEWSSDLSLHTFAAENAPNSLRARTSLAILLAERGDPDGAFRLLEESGERWPDDAFVSLLLVRQQSLFGILDPDHLRTAERRLGAGTLDEYAATVLARMRVDQRDERVDVLDASQLIRLYDAAFSARSHRLRHLNAAILHLLHAELLDETEQPAAAIEALRKALSFAPGNGEIRLRLAEKLTATGNFPRARETLSELEARLPQADYANSPRIRALARRMRADETAVASDERSP